MYPSGQSSYLSTAKYGSVDVDVVWWPPDWQLGLALVAVSAGAGGGQCASGLAHVLIAVGVATGAGVLGVSALCTLALVVGAGVVPGLAFGGVATSSAVYAAGEGNLLVGELRLCTAHPGVLLGVAGGGVCVAVSSCDVIHSLAMPGASLKCDAIPGRVALLWVVAGSAGALNAHCAEICGAFHSYMPLACAVV